MIIKGFKVKTLSISNIKIASEEDNQYEVKNPGDDAFHDEIFELDFNLWVSDIFKFQPFHFIE